MEPAIAARTGPPEQAPARGRAVGGVFWWITALALLVPIALLAASGWWTWQLLEREAKASAARTVTTMAEQARRLIAVQETLLGGALARVEGLDYEAIARSTEIPAFLSAQNRLADASPAVTLMRVDTGRLIAWSNAAPIQGIDVSERDYARAHRMGGPRTYIGEVVRSQPSGFLGFTISRRSADGRLAAVSLIEVAALQTFFDGLRQSPKDALSVLRDDGSILARIPSLANPIGARLQPGSLLSPASSEVRPGPFVVASPFDGVERMYEVRKVEPYPIQVAYGLSVASMRQEWRERMLPSLASTALACVLLILLSAYAARAVADRQRAEIQAQAARLAAASQKEAAELGENLRIALDGARLAPFERDLVTGEGRWGERIRQLYGLGPEFERNTTDDWMAIIHPDDRARVTADLKSAAEGRPSNTDYRIILPDGRVRWIASRGSLGRNAAGRPVKAVGVCFDITAAKEAEATLAEERRRLQVGKELAELGLGAVDYRTDVLTLDAAAAALFDLPAETPLPRSALRERLHPEDATRIEAALGDALAPDGDGRLAVEARILTPEGRPRWIAAQQLIEFEERDGGGRVPRAGILAMRDISQRRAREERIEFLLREVNHRSKNMLALVQAMARQTLAAGHENFFARFSERLQALAASHDLLVSNDWSGVDINALARSQLAHFEDALRDQVTLEGPQLMLSAAAAQAIGMALHELATNAAKYGALSTPSGRVALSWAVGPGAAGQTFSMRWAERDGPAVIEPERRGFGSTVMSRLVQSNLDAKVELTFEPTGLIWTMACAFADVAAVAAPEAGVDHASDGAQA